MQVKARYSHLNGEEYLRQGRGGSPAVPLVLIGVAP